MDIIRTRPIIANEYIYKILGLRPDGNLVPPAAVYANDFSEEKRQYQEQQRNLAEQEPQTNNENNLVIEDVVTLSSNALTAEENLPASVAEEVQQEDNNANDSTTLPIGNENEGLGKTVNFWYASQSYQHSKIEPEKNEEIDHLSELV